MNSAGNVVKASVTTLTSALNDYVAGQTVSTNPSRRAGSGLAFDSALLGLSSPSLLCAASSRCSPHAHAHLQTGTGASSWPLATFGSFVYRSESMQECAKAAALASFFYWSQTDPIALQNADRYRTRTHSTRTCTTAHDGY